MAQKPQVPDYPILSVVEIDNRWPILAMIQRSLDWHGMEMDVLFFCTSFSIEANYNLEELNRAELELAVLPGARLVKIAGMEPGEHDPIAPTACKVLDTLNS